MPVVPLGHLRLLPKVVMVLPEGPLQDEEPEEAQKEKARNGNRVAKCLHALGEEVHDRPAQKNPRGQAHEHAERLLQPLGVPSDGQDAHERHQAHDGDGRQSIDPGLRAHAAVS